MSREVGGYILRGALVVVASASIITGATMIAPEAGLLAIGGLTMLALWDLSR